MIGAVKRRDSLPESTNHIDNQIQTSVEMYFKIPILMSNNYLNMKCLNSKNTFKMKHLKTNAS